MQGQPMLGCVQACREEGAGSPCVSSRKVLPSQLLARAWHSCLYENKAHTASWQGCAHNSSRSPLCEAGKGEKSDTCPLITQTGNHELASSAVGQVVKSSPEDSPGEAVRSVFQQLCHRSASLHQEGPWHAPGHGGTASLLSSGSSQQSPSQIMASVELSSKNARCMTENYGLFGGVLVKFFMPPV